jgi:hypothetical protein
VPRFRFDYGPVVLAGSPPPLDGGGECYAPRRTILDSILVEAAAQAGAEVRPAFTVDGKLIEDQRVVGIRGHARGGVTLTERARLVVGADGRRSLVARAVAAPAYRARPALTCAYYSYWSDVPVEEEIEGYFLPRRVIPVFPTNDSQVCVFLQWPRAEFRSVRADVEGHVWAAVAQVPRLAERLRAGWRAARLVGTGDLPNFFRTPYGPGWALVGDAGYQVTGVPGTRRAPSADRDRRRAADGGELTCRQIGGAGQGNAAQVRPAGVAVIWSVEIGAGVGERDRVRHQQTERGHEQRGNVVLVHLGRGNIDAESMSRQVAAVAELYDCVE